MNAPETTTQEAPSQETLALMAREMARCKAYFPFRIVFGVVYAGTQTWEVHTCRNNRRKNALARAGHTVYELA